MTTNQTEQGRGWASGRRRPHLLGIAHSGWTGTPLKPIGPHFLAHPIGAPLLLQLQIWCSRKRLENTIYFHLKEKWLQSLRLSGVPWVSPSDSRAASLVWCPGKSDPLSTRTTSRQQPHTTWPTRVDIWIYGLHRRNERKVDRLENIVFNKFICLHEYISYLLYYVYIIFRNFFFSLHLMEVWETNWLVYGLHRRNEVKAERLENIIFNKFICLHKYISYLLI